MANKSPFAGRLLCLDVFRGLTIAGMILVNCPGNDDIYAPFKHAAWEGWTFADLVFPSFLVIMGASLALSLGRRREKGLPAGVLLTQAARRAAVMFALGLATSLFAPHEALGFRYMGVLQRIALCYLACSALFVATGPRAQAAATVAGLAGYWWLLTRVPVPGFGPGVLSPEGNLASYIDRLLMSGHIYHQNSDPEGLLSTIPAVSTSLMGVLAGQWLRRRERHARKAAGLMAAGLVCLAAGHLWGTRFPINKELWTSSFALFTGGAALLGLGACYWAVEIGRLTFWTWPFVVFGRNPLLSYFLSEMFYGLQEFIKMPVYGAPRNLKRWLCRHLFETWLSRPASALAYAVGYGTLFLFFMKFLYRRKIFLKA